MMNCENPRNLTEANYCRERQRLQQQRAQQAQQQAPTPPPMQQQQPMNPLAMMAAGKGLKQGYDWMQGKGLLDTSGPNFLGGIDMTTPHAGTASVPSDTFGLTTFAPGNNAIPVVDRTALASFNPAIKGSMMGGMPSSVAGLPAAPGAANALAGIGRTGAMMGSSGLPASVAGLKAAPGAANALLAAETSALAPAVGSAGGAAGGTAAATGLTAAMPWLLPLALFGLLG